MREIRTSGVTRGGEMPHGIRIVSHIRGNPDTEVCRSLNGLRLSPALPSLRWIRDMPNMYPNRYICGQFRQGAYGEGFHEFLRRECLDQGAFLQPLGRADSGGWAPAKVHHDPAARRAGKLTPVEFREGVQITLLEHGHPLAQWRRRGNGWKRRREINESSLYLFGGNRLGSM